MSGSFLEDPQETQEVSRQDNPPANPRASYQGHASAPVPSCIKLSPVQPVVGPFYPTSQRPLKPKLLGCRTVSPPLWIRGKVKTRKVKERPSNKYLLRTNSVDRPYVCGYPNCGKTYKSSNHLIRTHIFEHIGVSEYRCTYPQCGPDRYFFNKSAPRWHITREHLRR